jgi:hypothetical protein
MATNEELREALRAQTSVREAWAFGVKGDDRERWLDDIVNTIQATIEINDAERWQDVDMMLETAISVVLVLNKAGLNRKMATDIYQQLRGAGVLPDGYIR